MNTTKLIVISGCSGGGKSTLLSELSSHGYTVIEGVGRKIVKEHGEIDPLLRCEMIISKSIEAYHQAKNMATVKEGMIFFDRCILDGISYYQTISNKYDHFINELRYFPIIFMTPPWKEIYCQDDERGHSFEDAVAEYTRLLKCYPTYGYQILEIPKISVKERLQFVLSNTSEKRNNCMKVIETERLILRTWQDSDAAEFYRINQDQKVIEFLRGPLAMQEVKDFIAFVNQQFDKIGYTLWAAEEKSSGKLMGFIGLDPLKWEAPFGPCIEIAWRLGSEYWGKGYATEGAKAALEYGFNECGLKEIVSFTVPANIRSIRVMEKIGMQRDLNGDFAHPKLPKDHRLSKHVLYRARR